MITRIVKMTFKEEHINDFLNYFPEIVDRIRNQEGCNHVDLLHDVSDPRIFFTYSKWDSEKHLNAYRDSELFGQVWPKVKKWFDAKPEAWSVLSVEQEL
ncbi:MAG: antibiotic biosynthesis monooxygenase [Crocinitomicaceae bacterium]|nr:antibiotic biosynthesis monooxygenase [Crocinitomicaceae bacterium]